MRGTTDDGDEMLIKEMMMMMMMKWRGRRCGCEEVEDGGD